MSGLLQITKTEGRVVVLHLTGKLDAQTEHVLLDIARAEYESGTRSLLLDFSDVETISSAGLRALHTIYKMYTPVEEIRAKIAEQADKTYKSPYFKIAQATPQVHYVLSIAGFLQSIYMYPTLQEALDSFTDN